MDLLRIRSVFLISPGFALVVASSLGLCLTAITNASATQDVPSPWRKHWPKTSFSQTTVPITEITAGGPPRDGIPAINRPTFVDAIHDKKLSMTEAVIKVTLNLETRAYPLRVLIWHQIVNDTIGGTPIAVTYDPLCNTAIAFVRKIGDKVVTFGTTGKLRHSNLIMYDRETESWWQQFTGKAIIGRHAGKTLGRIPAVLESFGGFLKQHPNDRVLIPSQPKSRPYGRNPYPNYDVISKPYLYKGPLPKGIPAMARVAAFTIDGKPLAVAVSLLREKKQMTLGDYVLSWHHGQSSALSAREVAGGPDVGTVFLQTKKSNGTMADIAYEVPFAFAFHAFYPDAKIITD